MSNAFIQALLMDDPDTGGGGTYGCFYEDFSSLSSYTTVTGNRGLFTLGTGTYGNTLFIAAQLSATPARIDRYFTTRHIVTLSVRFRITTFSADDAAGLFLYGSSLGGYISINPARETILDPLNLKRIHLNLKQDTAGSNQLTIVGSAAVTLNSWYELTLTNTGTSYTYNVQNLTAGTLFASGTVTGSFTPIAVSIADFSVDSGGITCVTDYAQKISVCGISIPGVDGSERPSGLQATSAQGTLTVANPWQKFAGQALIASAGILIATQPNVSVALAGQSLTASQGTISSATQNKTVALVGQVATTAQGTNTVPPYPDLNASTITTTITNAEDVFVIIFHTDGTVTYSDGNTISGSLTNWIDTAQTNYSIPSINSQYMTVLSRGTNANTSFVQTTGGSEGGVTLSVTSYIIARSYGILLYTPIRFSVTVLPTSNNPRYSEVGYRSRYSFDITFSV